MHRKKILLSLALSIIATFLFFGSAEAKTGNVVDFAPSTNWYEWVIRSGVETGRGQTFVTTPTTTAIQSVAFKLCRVANFTHSKTVTLCSSATNGWYNGCQSPVAAKTFSASQLNAMINYDANCPASNEGGTNDGNYFKWTYFTFDNPVNVNPNTSYFFLLNSSSTNDNEPTNVLQNMYNNCNYLGTSADYANGQTYYYKGATKFNDAGGTTSCDMLFKVFSIDPNPPVFAITSPQNNDPEIRDTWITVSGTCPIVGTNRIGLTNDCLGFNKISYNLSCNSDHTFSGQFYYDGLGDKRVIARDASSTSGDCVDYDNLMDFKTVRTIEVINGYPSQWYANLNYYNDYDIKIKSPNFDTALTLPAGSTSSLFTFQFVYPASSTLANLQFTIKQYDNSGNLLNGSYLVKTLNSIADTQNYQTTLAASSTATLNYVVELTDTGQLKRQYPFAIYVSDLAFTATPDQSTSFLPRLVDVLKTKVVFNYFFAFHDGFYNLFNGAAVAVTSTALDITLKGVSDNNKYNLNIPVFTASDPTIQTFAKSLRPYITAFLWLLFALYVILRISRLFSNNNT